MKIRFGNTEARIPLQGLFWTAVLVLFASLDLRTFVQWGGGLPALLHFPSLRWSPFEALLQFWYAVFLVSFLVSAALLLARSPFAVVAAMGQCPWRLMSSHWTLEGLRLETLLIPDFGGPPVKLLAFLSIEGIRIIATIRAVRHFNPKKAPGSRGSPFSRRTILAALSAASLLVVVDHLNRTKYGFLRWRLDDGSLMWVTPIDEESYWLGRASGITQSATRLNMPGRLTAAECRQDSLGNYWVLAKAGEQWTKHPIFFNTKSQEYGPGKGWDGDLPEGKRIEPARSALLPF